MVFFFYHFARFCMSPNDYKRHPQMSNYCILFAGYKRDSKLARSFEFIFMLVHFLIGFALGVLYAYPLVQIIIVLSLCALLLIYTLAIRPFYFTVVLVFEIITQLLLIVALIGLLVSISYEKSGCFTCANREGFLCYLILAALFGYLLLLALGLLAFAFMAGCCGHSMFYKRRQIPENIDLSEGQNLSHMAEINNVNHMNYGQDVRWNENTMTNYQGIANSGEHYKQEQMVKTVVINEEKNESFKHAENKNEFEDHKLFSQKEEVVVGKRDSLMDESDEDEESFSLRERNERTIHEFDQDIKDQVTSKRLGQYEGHAQYYTARTNQDNSLLDRTMTVKVDTDDERMRQNKVLHALSVSEINNEAMEDNQNQVNQARKVIEMNKRSQMISRQNFDESDADQFSRRLERDTREFHLGHDFDGTSNRNMTVRRFEGGSDFGTEKDFLSETGVVKTRVQSQAVRNEFDSGGRDGGHYYHQEYEERRYTRNN